MEQINLVIAIISDQLSYSCSWSNHRQLCNLAEFNFLAGQDEDETVSSLSLPAKGHLSLFWVA
jgi:hypothetical protein